MRPIFNIDLTSSMSEFSEKSLFTPLIGLSLLSLGFIGLVVGLHLTWTRFVINGTMKPMSRAGSTMSRNRRMIRFNPLYIVAYGISP